MIQPINCVYIHVYMYTYRYIYTFCSIWYCPDVCALLSLSSILSLSYHPSLFSFSFFCKAPRDNLHSNRRIIQMKLNLYIYIYIHTYIYTYICILSSLPVRTSRYRSSPTCTEGAGGSRGDRRHTSPAYL